VRHCGRPPSRVEQNPLNTELMSIHGSTVSRKGRAVHRCGLFWASSPRVRSPQVQRTSGQAPERARLRRLRLAGGWSRRGARTSAGSRSRRIPRQDRCRKLPSRVNDRYSISPTSRDAPMHRAAVRWASHPTPGRTNGPANGGSSRCRGPTGPAGGCGESGTDIPTADQLAVQVMLGEEGAQHVDVARRFAWPLSRRYVVSFPVVERITSSGGTTMSRSSDRPCSSLSTRAPTAALARAAVSWRTVVRSR
jgi:hypothetical protein